MSVITVQIPTGLNTQHIYALYASDDLPLDLIPLAVDDKINHKYPKSLSIPVFNTTYDRVDIPRETVIGRLNPIEIENTVSQEYIIDQDRKITR